MAAPKSFRLPEALVVRIEEHAAAAVLSQTDLVTSLLDEGLKTRRYPGIIYRDGPTGRRAGLAAGPDVWEVIGTVRHVEGKGDAKVVAAAEMLSLPERSVRLAVEFYSAFNEEVDDRIRANDEAAERLREQAERRERLLS